MNARQLSKKRELVDISLPHSVISGTGVSSPIEPFQTYTVTLDAKDSSGSDITTGGEQIVIEIRNKCTISGKKCIAESGAQ